MRDPRILQAWWWHKQGFGGELTGRTPAEVLQHAGWARSVGGVGPYLAVFARSGSSRQAIDEAAARMDICELPSARGCTYVLPAADFALGLLAGQGFSDESEMKVARKLGVTDSEIDVLCTAIVDVLRKQTLDPKDIRTAVGDKARSLGPEGTKKGISTTLPLALGKLQVAGEIRRVSANGRLDNQRYKYTVWKPNPLAKSKLTRETAYAELAKRFFRWIGAAEPSEFQTFAGISEKASRPALQALELIAAESGDARQILAAERDAFARFRVPKEPQYALVSGLDSLILLRRRVDELLDEADRKQDVFGGKTGTDHITEVPNHVILDRGRIVGLWEYDPTASEIVTRLFIPSNKDLRAAIARTEAFVRDELGDARTFSLDSPKSRAPKIEALRAAAKA